MPPKQRREKQAFEKRVWPRIMDAAREIFLPDNPYGVFAFGIGPLIRKGHRQAALGLNVHVQRKRAAPLAPIPVVSVRMGREVVVVRPNVVAAGGPPRPGAGGEPVLGGLSHDPTHLAP